MSGIPDLPAEAIDAAAKVVRAAWHPPLDDTRHDGDIARLARLILEAAAPAIRAEAAAAERGWIIAMAREYQAVCKLAVGDYEAFAAIIEDGTEPDVVAQAAAAERERIRQLAIDRDATAWDDRDAEMSGRIPFADLLQDQP